LVIQIVDSVKVIKIRQMKVKLIILEIKLVKILKNDRHNGTGKLDKG